MGEVRDDPVPDGEFTHLATDPRDDPQVAVTDPAGEVRCPGHLFGSLEIASIGPDLQSTDAGAGPDLSWPEVVGFERVLFDPQVTRPMEDGDLHGVGPGV